jgi:hypothetical protein
MREGDANGNKVRYDDLPEAELRILTPQQDKMLRDYSYMLDNGQQFGKMDYYARPKGSHDAQGNLILGSVEEWADMSEAEQAETDLFHPAWRMGLTESKWNKLYNDQQEIISRKERGIGVGREDAVMTNDQIVASIVPSLTSIPATGRTNEQNELYQRIRAEHADRVDELQREKYGRQKAPFHERRDLLLQMLSEEAMIRRKDFGIDWLDTDERRKLYEIPAEDTGAAYIPLSEWEKSETTEIVDGQEVKITWKQLLINKAKAQPNGRDPTDADLESAYFAVRAGYDNAEILRRLNGGR